MLTLKISNKVCNVADSVNQYSILRPFSVFPITFIVSSRQSEVTWDLEISPDGRDDLRDGRDDILRAPDESVGVRYDFLGH